MCDPPALEPGDGAAENLRRNGSPADEDVIADGQRAFDREPKVGEGFQDALHGAAGFRRAPEPRRRVVRLADLTPVQHWRIPLRLVIGPGVARVLHRPVRRGLAGAAELSATL